MWFSSVFLKTLRDYRIAIFGWGLGLGLLMYTVLSAVSALIATPAARADLVSLAGSFAWIAEPIHVDTAGGYATWKYGFTILILALWPILVGSRMLRGEEERGSMDVLLSLPRGRARVALEKLAAMWMALLLMGLLIGLLTFAAGASVKANFGLGGALLFGFNLALICGVFGEPRAPDLAVYPGTSLSGGHHGGAAGAGRDRGYDPSGHPKHRRHFTPLARLLLQSEQAVDPELRH